MSAMDKTRAAAREFLDLVAGTPAPEWRTCFSTDGTDEPTGFAPVCDVEGHDPDDGNVYSCCPNPVVECDSGPLAAYLVELLNADRAAASVGIDRETAAHVLWRFGHEGGYPPGDHAAALLRLIAGADVVNRARFAAGFPALAEAVRMASNDRDGIARLQQIAKGGTA
ncbi:hypothetical protein [Streptomyces sp. NPDC101115]|uniref:hypothetical protein n=1 Tax=Streptomyces sp. NPDC101115 TaxID=3366106 RepID=UPI003827AAAD